MPQIARSSLRARLLFLALLVFLPALGLIFYGALEERQRAAQAAQTEALRFARLASLEQAQVFEGARQLLLGLAQSPAVLRRDGSRCNALFSAVLAQFQGYTNISAATPDGAVFCSAVPLTAPVNFGDRPYFQQALKTRRFAVSSYVIGRITGKPNVAVAQVAVDGAGAVQAVVVAGLDTSWLNHLAADAQLPRGSALTVIDSKGVVLTRYPAGEQWTGKAVPEAPVAKAVLAGRREGTVTGPGLDGVERLYTFTRLPTPPESGDVYI
ncbi:MAG TPA: cache domain-containing protein, partial [Methylomirabilota bacterium]|nr:cache domain-containing protein [Methylomirabilota bacterium]